MNERIGIIGVGAIAADIVGGLLGEGESTREVVLSPRGAAKARALAGEFAGARVAPDNQGVVDSATTILLAVRADIAAEVLRGLSIPADRLLISAVAGITLGQLRAAAGEGPTIVRSIPMPAVRRRGGLTAMYPANDAAQALFDRLGGTLVTDDEGAFSTLSAASATVSTHLSYLTTIASWAAENGVDAGDAEEFVRRTFAGVGAALAEPGRGLAALTGHETPGGLNEQIRTGWFDERNGNALRDALDGVRGRVAKVEPSREPGGNAS